MWFLANDPRVPREDPRARLPTLGPGEGRVHRQRQLAAPAVRPRGPADDLRLRDDAAQLPGPPGQRFPRSFLLGLALAIAGAAVLVSNSLSLSAETVQGDAFGLLAAVFYAGYLLGVARERARFSAVEVMFWTTLATAALLLPIALAAGETLWPSSLDGWLVLLGLAAAQSRRWARA